jgi:hypothetical protein
MSPQSRSTSFVEAPPGTDRVRVVKRESRRDLAGVAVGVAIGALLWFLVLAVAQMWS